MQLLAAAVRTLDDTRTEALDRASQDAATDTHIQDAATRQRDHAARELGRLVAQYL